MCGRDAWMTKATEVDSALFGISCWPQTVVFSCSCVGWRREQG